VIHLPAKQGSPEWFALRLGIPTASCFDKIITPKQRKASASQTKYLCQKVSERLFGVTADGTDTDFMARGRELEQSAATAYEFEREVETTVAGFCLDDERRYGCSPDRLVGEDGGIQIKCLSEAEHIRALLFPDTMEVEHGPQCHGEMLVTGRLWWDLVFYNPVLPMKVVRIMHDPEYEVDLKAELDKFCNWLDYQFDRLRDEVGVVAGARTWGNAPTESKAAPTTLAQEEEEAPDPGEPALVGGYQALAEKGLLHLLGVLGALRMAHKGERKFWTQSGKTKRPVLIDGPILLACGFVASDGKTPLAQWLDDIARQDGAWLMVCRAVHEECVASNVKAM